MLVLVVSGCLTQEHEDQVELQRVGEAYGVSQHRRERQAEQTSLIKDGQRLDHSHRWNHDQSDTLSNFYLCHHFLSKHNKLVANLQPQPQAGTEGSRCCI